MSNGVYDPYNWTPQRKMSENFMPDQGYSAPPPIGGEKLATDAGTGAAMGGLTAGQGALAGAGIGAGVSLVASLAQIQAQREQTKIQNEISRRKEMQDVIERGSMGRQQSIQSNLQNLAKAFM